MNKTYIFEVIAEDDDFGLPMSYKGVAKAENKAKAEAIVKTKFESSGYAVHSLNVHEFKNKTEIISVH